MLECWKSFVLRRKKIRTVAYHPLGLYRDPVPWSYVNSWQDGNQHTYHGWRADERVEKEVRLNVSHVTCGSGYNRKKKEKKQANGPTQPLLLLLWCCYLTAFWTTVLTCSVVEPVCWGSEDGLKQEGNLTAGWARSRTSSYKRNKFVHTDWWTDTLFTVHRKKQDSNWNLSSFLDAHINMSLDERKGIVR